MRHTHVPILSTLFFLSFFLARVPRHRLVPLVKFNSVQIQHIAACFVFLSTLIYIHATRIQKRARASLFSIIVRLRVFFFFLRTTRARVYVLWIGLRNSTGCDDTSLYRRSRDVNSPDTIRASLVIYCIPKCC